MKQIKSSVLLLAFFSITTTTFANVEKESISDVVIRRYYLIERLSDEMEKLHKIFKETNNGLQKSFDMYHIIHQSKLVPQRGMQRGAIKMKPLFMIWDDFFRYCALDGELMIEDFTGEIYFVLPDNDTDRHAPHTRRIGISTQPTPYEDIDYTVNADLVMERFYLTKRLTQTFELLSAIDNYEFILAKDGTLEGDDELEFNDPVIINVLQEIFEQKSLNPLMQCFEAFKTHTNIDDTQLHREIALCAFLALNNLIAKFVTTRTGAIQEYFDNRARIQGLSLEEILNEVDLIAKELPALLDKNSKNTTSFFGKLLSFFKTSSKQPKIIFSPKKIGMLH